MVILCRILGHRQGGRVLKNRKVQFGSCTRCGCDLVRRSGSAWRKPRGYRIVWPAEPNPLGTPDPAPAAERQDVARILLYKPAPGEPDFMESDAGDRFEWEAPFADAPGARDAAPRPRRQRWLSRNRS